MEIKVEKQKETEGGWEFLVRIEDIEYSVTLDREYWEKLVGDREEPIDLVRRSFEFLLEREPKESILRQFNIKVISRYFPEYEREIIKPAE